MFSDPAAALSYQTGSIPWLICLIWVWSETFAIFSWVWVWLTIVQQRTDFDICTNFAGSHAHKITPKRHHHHRCNQQHQLALPILRSAQWSQRLPRIGMVSSTILQFQTWMSHSNENCNHKTSSKGHPCAAGAAATNTKGENTASADDFNHWCEKSTKQCVTQPPNWRYWRNALIGSFDDSCKTIHPNAFMKCHSFRPNENATSTGINSAIPTRIHVWEKPKYAQLQTCTWSWSSKCGQHNEIIWLFTVKHVNQVTSVHLEIQQNQITEGGHSESYSVLLIPPAQKPIRQPHQYPPSKQLWTQGPQPIVFQHPAREPMIDQYCQSKLPGHRLPTMVSSHQLQLMNLHQLNFHQLVSKLMSAMRWPHLTVSQWTVQRWPCSPLLRWESHCLQTNNTWHSHLWWTSNPIQARHRNRTLHSGYSCSQHHVMQISARHNPVKQATQVKSITIRLVPASMKHCHVNSGASPIGSLLQAVEKGWLTSFPGLTTARVEEHCRNSKRMSAIAKTTCPIHQPQTQIQETHHLCAQVGRPKKMLRMDGSTMSSGDCQTNPRAIKSCLATCGRTPHSHPETPFDTNPSANTNQHQLHPPATQKQWYGHHGSHSHHHHHAHW